MSKIINGGRSEKHVIKNYTFKEIIDSNVNKNNKEDDNFVKQEINNQPNAQNSSPNSNDNKIIENLLLKIEELSNNIATIQTQFQNQISEIKSSCEKEKQDFFNQGYQKGVEEGKTNCVNELNEKMQLLEESISKINKINDIFEEKILSIEKELISVALDIAKEVIQKEISKESEKIAYSLAKSLMQEIKDATKIKIKVNPKDAKFLENKFENVEIIPDSAIKEGGVVIVSDIGNIDAEVLERFKNVKDAILEGKE